MRDAGKTGVFTPPGQEPLAPKLLDYYAQRRDGCLYVLLHHVDQYMHRYAAHIIFQDAYHEARNVLMKLTVQARAAYFTGSEP